jgi:hypothetical protein
MFRYYFLLGLRNLARNPILTGLMVLTLAVGVAASISTLTILHVMSGNPIPHKSARLLVPLVDNGPVKSYVPGSQPEDGSSLSYRDADQLPEVRAGRVPHRDLRSGAIEVGGPDRRSATQRSRRRRGLFSMFEVPFLRQRVGAHRGLEPRARRGSERNRAKLFGKTTRRQDCCASSGRTFASSACSTRGAGPALPRLISSGGS